MNSIISYLLSYNQYLLQVISFLCNFICRFIPLKQFEFDDSRSPKYQKLKVDRLPIILESVKQDYTFLIEYYHKRYGKTITLSDAVTYDLFPSLSFAPFALHHTNTSTTITAVTDNFSARFAIIPLLTAKRISPSYTYFARIVPMP